MNNKLIFTFVPAAVLAGCAILQQKGSFVESVKANDISAIKKQVLAGVDLNAVDKNGNPPLIRAIKFGNIEAVN